MTRSSQAERSELSGASVSSSSMRTSCWWRRQDPGLRRGDAARHDRDAVHADSGGAEQLADAVAGRVVAGPTRDVGVDAEPREVERDVAGATDGRRLAAEAHDRDRSLGRDAGDLADQVAVEHEVADDEHARAGEAAADAGVHEVRPVKHRAPLPPSRTRRGGRARDRGRGALPGSEACPCSGCRARRRRHRRPCRRRSP